MPIEAVSMFFLVKLLLSQFFFDVCKKAKFIEVC
jgi:hypothetical protein